LIVLIPLLKGLVKTLRNWQVIAVLVLVQLIGAWLMAMPLTSEFHRAWDHSLLAEDGAERPELASAAVDEVLIERHEFLGAMYSRTFIAMSGLAYVLFSILMLAGALPLYSGLDLKFSWDRFWANASRYFRPFVGLAVIAAVAFLAAGATADLFEGAVKDALIGNNDEASVFITGVLVTGAFRFIIFSLVVMVFQYAKVIAAAEGLRNIIYLIRRAVVFVLRNFVVALVLFSLLGAIEVGIVALDSAVWNFVLQDAESAVSLTWLVLMTAMLITVKLSFFSSQLLLFDEISRRASDGVRVDLDSRQYEAAY